MGKRLRVQRRGRGSPTFKAPTHKRVAQSRYIPIKKTEETGVVQATVEGLEHDPGRGAPLARCKLDIGRSFYIVAPEGIAVGQTIQIGSSAQPAIGNILPIGAIPSGTFVCNIERQPGDGGKLIRASGGYASIVSHMSDKTSIKLSSGKSVHLNNACLATVGVVSGAGRTAKPFLKAGKKN
ncbi:MAG: 50S ribosomal protein L2, partial [Candidatus Bathyarchaeota archaeon]